MDLIHAHGVFVYLPFFDSLRYFKKIDRVTAKNSYIVFDCITEDYLGKKSINGLILTAIFRESCRKNIFFTFSQVININLLEISLLLMDGGNKSILFSSVSTMTIKTPLRIIKIF